MVRTNFDRQMAELNDEIVAMGLLCKQAIDKVDGYFAQVKNSLVGMIAENPEAGKISRHGQRASRE
ncbi:MAG: hypothetical protein IJC51_03095 [Eggerthellaceae bacterium]|nr:hypothetical protein [Eggerthellaceae bacterium]